MKIILITRDRPELTKQTIETMRANAANWDKHDLVVVFDGTAEEMDRMFPPGSTDEGEMLTGKQLGVGGAKNYGVDWSYIQGDEILMFSDNDMYYLPGWDKRLEYCLDSWDVVQVGGWRHPYHKQGEYIAIPCEFDDGWGKSLCKVDAVTGNCFVIRYKDWLKYGPFDSNALGPGQSEDYAFSQKIIKDGGIVATLDPPVAIHCGLANCEGNPATGWEEMAQMAEKQIEENKIDRIWLATPDEGTILLERQMEKPNREFSGLNIGSGQRKFDRNCGWTNIDCISRPPDQVPDIVLDATRLTDKFAKNSQDMVVLHHVIEHFGCGEADEVLRQCYKVLKPGGSLLIFVPDLRKLAGRWLSGELEDFLFFVNVYGAYQGEEGDRHRWGYDKNSLESCLKKAINTASIDYFFIGCELCGTTTEPCKHASIIKLFDWREIPGADIASDWWILGVEIVK